MAQQSIRRQDPPLSNSVFQMFSMKGKVVIITGGAGAIGIEVARGLAEAGADVALWYNSSPKADELAAGVAKEYGTKVKAYKVAVQNFDEVCIHTPILVRKQDQSIDFNISAGPSSR